MRSELTKFATTYCLTNITAAKDDFRPMAALAMTSISAACTDAAELIVNNSATENITGYVEHF